MSNDSHLSEGLLHHSLKTTGKMIDQGCGKRDGPDFTTIMEFGLAVFALLTFFGVGAIKVIFRKNPRLTGWA